MLKISANDAQLTVVACGPITSDRIDLPCEITLSKEFDGLAVTVVFKAGDVQRDVAMLGSPVHVPAECLEQAGEVLMVGIWAGDGSGRPTIPTVWASAGTIRTGALPSGYDPDEPEPDWAAQVQQAAAQAVATANSVRADADAGVFDGEDGYSPTATVEQLADGATITITDKDGTTTATVHDGADGRDGTDGADGYSPTATVTQTTTGATISITDKSGTTTASVSNGTDGADGTDGSDGFSPTVDVQPITGGHEVTITDADGPHSFEVLDGDPAAPGSITDAMLAPDGIKAQVAQLFGNQLTSTLSGTIATAADAYAAPPMSLAVYGASTQAGTPTPDAPVPILSVDELTVHASPSDVLVWNQLARVDGVFTNTDYWASDGAFSSTGTEHTVTATSNGQVFGCRYSRSLSVHPIANHKYYISLDAKGDVPFTVCLYTGSITVDRAISGVNLTSSYVRHSGIATCTYSVGQGLRMAAYPNTSVVTGNYFTFKNLQFIDLTLMYGAGNEPTSVAEVQADLPADFYAFDTGTPNDYTNWPVNDLLPEGTSLRSLPDGTKDTLSLSYLRPSTRAGWAWYGRTLTALVGETTTAATDGITGTVGVDVMSTTGEIADGPTVLYKLASAQTTTLDPIELPELPAPNCTVWCDGGSAQPTYQMQYVQDTNLVIADMRAALADLATS